MGPRRPKRAQAEEGEEAKKKTGKAQATAADTGAAAGGGDEDTAASAAGATAAEKAYAAEAKELQLNKTKQQVGLGGDTAAQTTSAAALLVALEQEKKGDRAHEGSARANMALARSCWVRQEENPEEETRRSHDLDDDRSSEAQAKQAKRTQNSSLVAIHDENTQVPAKLLLLSREC